MLNTEKTLEKLVALSKGRGFVYAGSEIYGGLANTWVQTIRQNFPLRKPSEHYHGSLNRETVFGDSSVYRDEVLLNRLMFRCFLA